MIRPSPAPTLAAHRIVLTIPIGESCSAANEIAEMKTVKASNPTRHQRPIRPYLSDEMRLCLSQ